MREYDEIFEWFVANRSAAVGVPAVAAVASRLAPGATVLELGCGTGVPIAQYLAARGFAIFGVDSAPRMIAEFQRNIPAAAAECARIEESRFFDRSFAAIVAWGVLFHLPPDDQELVIRKAAHALEPGGTFLFTAARERGTARGEMAGIPFRYESLGLERYAELLKSEALDLASHGEDDNENYVYVYVCVKGATPRLFQV